MAVTCRQQASSSSKASSLLGMVAEDGAFTASPLVLLLLLLLLLLLQVAAPLALILLQIAVGDVQEQTRREQDAIRARLKTLRGARDMADNGKRFRQEVSG